MKHHQFQDRAKEVWIRQQYVRQPVSPYKPDAAQESPNFMIINSSGK